jgi:iron(III) transport system permease protein
LNAASALRRAPTYYDRHRPAWVQTWPVYAVLLLAILFFASPVLALLWQVLTIGGIGGISIRSLQRASLATGWLLAGTAFVILITAVPLAWLLARYRFFGRGFLQTVAVLPLALPVYLAAYCHVAFFDHFGPLQNGLRSVFGLENTAQFPLLDLRNGWGASFVMGIALYPYVFVPARLAFARQSARYLEAAQLLGLPQSRMFWQIALPLAWPAIALGLTLALLETLNDIGATQYLGVNAMTAAIYQTWVIRDDFSTAVVLSLLLLTCVALLIFVERRLQRRIPRLESQRHQASAAAIRLSGWRAACAFWIGFLPPLFGFFLPSSILVRAAWHDLAVSGLRDDVLAALVSTGWLAMLAIMTILLLGFAIALMHRLAQSTIGNIALRFSLAGYAIPGLMLVIVLMPMAGAFDQWLIEAGIASSALLSGSVTLLVIAYALRFTGISASQAESSLGQLSHNADYAARTLGAGRWRLTKQILVPQILPAAGAAAILVLVDCIKELPATILLRPLNFETLSTLVYGHASRGAFEDGAVAALLITVMGLIPILFLGRAMSPGRFEHAIEQTKASVSL